MCLPAIKKITIKTKIKKLLGLNRKLFRIRDMEPTIIPIIATPAILLSTAAI